MWRVVTSTFAAFTLFTTVAAAQQPCTTDANRVVSEIYRHTLERGADPGAQTWVRQLANGQITVKFDDNIQTMDLKPGHKQSGATFDRFGFFNMQSGGWHVQLYVDDLKYTKAPGK